jgi:predicted enzyme related to lactoylglutathione lyase
MENNKRPTRSNGKICYIEIPAHDASRSADFYKTVFNWNIRKRGDGAIAFDDTVGEVSGAWVTGRRVTDPGYLIYIMVDDIVATMNTVLESGGKIVQPPGADAPEITARFSDPDGNIFGLYQEPAQK